MTSSSGLYGAVTTQNVNSGNSTSLYGEAGTPIPDSSGNLVVRGTLTVNGCAILTNCTSFSFLPLNATSINIGNSATNIDIGSASGTTTINNQLTTANYSFPVADGTANQVLITDGAGVLSFASVGSLDTNYTIQADTTTGGANLTLVGSDATTDSVKFASGTGVTVSRTDASTITLAIGQSVATSASPTFASMTLTGDLAVNGGDITSTAATFNLLNTTPTTINFGGAATTVRIGAATGNTTVNNGLILGGETIKSSDGSLVATTASPSGNITFANNATITKSATLGDSGARTHYVYGKLDQYGDDVTTSVDTIVSQVKAQTYTSSTTAAGQIIYFVTNNGAGGNDWAGGKFIIMVTSGGEFHMIEMMVLIQNSTDGTWNTQYGELYSTTPLATFTVDRVTSGTWRILATPVNAVTTFKTTGTLIAS